MNTAMSKIKDSVKGATVSQPTNDNEDSDFEEEEVLVLVELHGVIDTDMLDQTHFDKFKMIGIDSDQPILQMEDVLFAGEYKEIVGTAVIFEEEKKSNKNFDPVFDTEPVKRLKHYCSTEKMLVMKRVFAKEKDENPSENGEDK